MRKNGFYLLAATSISLSAQAFSGVQTYKYDANGQLIVRCSTTKSQGYKVIYDLDTAGNRKAYNSTTTAFSISMGNGIYSQDGRFFLTMQTDNHFVLYGPSGPLWWSNTVGSGAQTAAFQSDGNLVLYTPTGAAIWASGTYAPCATLALQNDGNLVIYNVDGLAVWSTNTGGH